MITKALQLFLRSFLSPITNHLLRFLLSQDFISDMANRQQCASCRQLRLNCEQNCSLAPHFPAHMQQRFRNANKVFGRSYITKLLHDLRHESPQKSNLAMKNLIAEANARIADPVGGSYRIVKQQCAEVSRLERKVAEQEQELQELRRRLGGASLSLCQEQGNIVPPRTQQEQGYRNLGEQIGNAQSQAYVQPPTLLQLFPEVPGLN